VSDKAATAPPGNYSNEATISKALSTPAVRHLAKKEGVDINKVPGTGLRGRVTKGDLLEFIKSGHGTASQAIVAPSHVVSAAPTDVVSAALSHVVSSGGHSGHRIAPLTGVTD